MDQSAASSLAGLAAYPYTSRYNIPKSARIPRKPLAPSHHASLLTLRDEASSEVSELRNPLAKAMVQILPEKIGPRPCTDTSHSTTVVGDTTPRRLPDHLARRLVRHKSPDGRVEIWHEFLHYWLSDIIWLLVSLCCFISKWVYGGR
jgi:hypothetical protein